MDYWKEAYNVADIVFLNSRLMWIVYISFFIMALIIRRSENKTRKTVGGVMTAASIPGLLISAGLLGLFVYVMIKVYQVAASKEFYLIGDSPVVRDLKNACNSVPVTALELSLFMFFILANIAIICGIIILARKAGKAVGIITLLYGIGLMCFSGWFVKALLTFLAA